MQKVKGPAKQWRFCNIVISLTQTAEDIAIHVSSQIIAITIRKLLGLPAVT